jgi:hypothetical protein
MRTLVLLLASAFIAQAQDLGSSTLTAGFGGAFPVSGYRTSPFHAGLAFTADYEIGLHRYLAANVGLDNYLLNFDNYTRGGIFNTRERVTLLPFGVRGIVPLSRRADFFVGTGAAYLWSTAPDLSLYGGEGFLWQVNGGVRVKLGTSERWRVGATVHFYRDLGRPTQQWTSLTAEFGYHFGK